MFCLHLTILLQIFFSNNTLFNEISSRSSVTAFLRRCKLVNVNPFPSTNILVHHRVTMAQVFHHYCFLLTGAPPHFYLLSLGIGMWWPSPWLQACMTPDYRVLCQPRNKVVTCWKVCYYSLRSLTCYSWLWFYNHKAGIIEANPNESLLVVQISFKGGGRGWG